MSTHAVIGYCPSAEQPWLVFIGTGPACRRVRALLTETPSHGPMSTNWYALSEDVKAALLSAAHQYVRSTGEASKFKNRTKDVAEWLIFAGASYCVEAAPNTKPVVCNE